MFNPNHPSFGKEARLKAEITKKKNKSWVYGNEFHKNSKTNKKRIETMRKKKLGIFDAARKGAELESLDQQLLDQLLARLEGVMQARESKYVMLHAPREALEKITELLPGVEHPSVMPLEGSNRIAIHAVCGEAVYWEHMEALKAAGASAILVLPVEKMLA